LDEEVNKNPGRTSQSTFVEDPLVSDINQITGIYNQSEFNQNKGTSSESESNQNTGTSSQIIEV
jgi:hypothetical protein